MNLQVTNTIFIIKKLLYHSSKVIIPNFAFLFKKSSSKISFFVSQIARKVDSNAEKAIAITSSTKFNMPFKLVSELNKHTNKLILLLQKRLKKLSFFSF